MPAATASRARALAALPRTCPLADPDLASSRAPTATISSARRCRPRTPVRGRRRDARLFQQPRQIASFAPSHPRRGRRTVPARTGRSPAPIGECQMMTRADKSALAAANYVTRRHRRPASIIRQQARRKTEPWPSQQAQITSDLYPQLKDAERPLAAQIGGNVRTGADQPRSLSVIGIPGRRVPYRRILRLLVRAGRLGNGAQIGQLCRSSAAWGWEEVTDA